MGSAEFARGAQMALQAFGIADQVKQRELMNKLHEMQIGKAERDVQAERQMSGAITPWAQQFQAPEFGQYGGMSSEFGPPESFARTPGEQDWNQLAAKIAGIPGGLPQAINLLKMTTGDMQRDTPQDKLNRVITAAMLRQQTQNPNISIQQDTDDKGNVTITGIDKGSGQQLWQKNLGPIGKTLPPSYAYLPTSEGYAPAITRGPGAGTVKEPSGLGKALPAGSIKELGDLDALKVNILETRNLYKYGTPEERKDWVGPVYGRVGAAREKYTGGATEEQVKFYAYVRDMKDALLRARSGAQINEQEYARLVAFLPDEYMPAPTFRARLDRFDREVDIITMSKKAALKAGGYGPQQPNSKQPTNPVNNDPLGIR